MKNVYDYSFVRSYWCSMLMREVALNKVSYFSVVWWSEMEETVTFEVGGTVFKTKRTTLNTIEGSLLSRLDKRKYVYYFDRDPTAFRHILYAHRYGRIHVPKDICPIQFREEMLYWGIPKRLIAPCCWKFIYETEGDVETLKIFVDRNARFANYNQIHPSDDKPVGVDMFASNGELNIISPDKANDPWKKPKDAECGACDNDPAYKVWNFLDEPASSSSAKVMLILFCSLTEQTYLRSTNWPCQSRTGKSFSMSFMRNNDQVDVNTSLWKLS